MARHSRRNKALRNRADRAAALLNNNNEIAERNTTFRFLDLPNEIRHMIYRLCFSRPIGIVPTVNFYRRRRRRTDERMPGDGLLWRKYHVYRYQWELHSQILPQTYPFGLPTRDGTIDTVIIQRSQLAPPEQQALIAADDYYGVRSLFPSFGISTSDHSATTYSSTLTTDNPVRIYGAQMFYTSGFTGVRLLRTCKQIQNEGTKVLYGSNKYIFNVSNIHHDSAFNCSPEEIPGVRLSNGSLPSEEQISEAIDKLFDRKVRHCAFIWNDPFLRFLTAIGPHNASLLKSVEFTGGSRNPDTVHLLMSLAQTLPVYTLMMGRMCHSLNKVTFDNVKRHIYWRDDDGGKYRGKTHDERICDAVENFVKGIPQLKQLQLGSTENRNEHGWNGPSISGMYMDEGYGTAMKWVEFVRDRAKSRRQDDTAVQNEDLQEGDITPIEPEIGGLSLQLVSSR